MLVYLGRFWKLDLYVCVALGMEVSTLACEHKVARKLCADGALISYPVVIYQLPFPRSIPLYSRNRILLKRFEEARLAEANPRCVTFPARSRSASA
jgi:hypothetical protein